MYKAIAHFRYQDFHQDPVTLISQILNQWRLNGQVIGREMGITYHQNTPQPNFQVQISIPEQESLLPQWNNSSVNEAFLQAEQQGVFFEFFEVIGRDYHAEETSRHNSPFLILYTTHLDTCSPIYNGADFCPIPLYKIVNQPDLSEKIIKWQENWQACDQLQMNGDILEQQALYQICDERSELSQQGRALARQIESISNIPTYYYLYRLGRESHIEYQRKCPNCHSNWKLPETLHNIFHFKCESCRLISNLSWELQ